MANNGSFTFRAWRRRIGSGLLVLSALGASSPADAARAEPAKQEAAVAQASRQAPTSPDVNAAPAKPRKISLLLRDTPLSDVMAMLAKSEHVNILLAKGVTGEVNVNLSNVNLEEAIYALAGAAGFAVERRDGAYIVVKREEVGKYAQGGLTRLRTFKVQYAKAESIESIIKNHLSAYGKVTKLAERKLLVVEDTPEFLERITQLMQELDRQPRQILIEAKILEISLTDDESFGFDWSKIFTNRGEKFSLGVQGLSRPASGLDFHVVNPLNLDIVLTALRARNRVRTLSTPKLLALEDLQAETIIGDRTGYKVTTTINQVTQESIQFLESGVILKVTPSVDNANRILLAIHPEVSRGTLDANGIPSLTTTEVTTNMLVEDSQTILIAGLIKQTTNETRDGVPVLGDIPVLGYLFSNKASNISRTETIVLITPHIVGNPETLYDEEIKARTEDTEQDVDKAVDASDKSLRLLLDQNN